MDRPNFVAIARFRMYNIIIGTAVAESNRMAYRELLALAARNVFELFKSSRRRNIQSCRRLQQHIKYQV